MNVSFSRENAHFQSFINLPLVLCDILCLYLANSSVTYFAEHEMVFGKFIFKALP